MLKRFLLRKRLFRTLERVEFQSMNPKSNLYGFFVVKKISDGDKSVYNFSSFRIEKLDKKEIDFYHNGVLQMQIIGLKTKTYNDDIYISSLFEKTDEYTNNYTTLND